MEDEMPADSDLALAELRGSLEAFARFNNKTNHGYTFTLDVLPLTGSIEQSIKCSFGDDVTKVSVFPLTTGRRMFGMRSGGGCSSFRIQRLDVWLIPGGISI
jgi:hypothetical protein